MSQSRSDPPRRRGTRPSSRTRSWRPTSSLRRTSTSARAVRPTLCCCTTPACRRGEAALERLTSAESKVSSHYVVFEDGRIVQCVPEDKRAWHAGVSSWAGETDINSRSIGIEIVNPGHEFGYPDFPLRQIAAVITLCRIDPHPPRTIVPSACWRIPTSRRRASRIRARSFPGNCSPIPASAIGCAPAPLNVTGIDLEPGYTRRSGAAACSACCKPTATASRRPAPSMTSPRDVVIAFQRHFRQARVDGIADPSTLMTLRALVETMPKREASAS